MDLRGSTVASLWESADAGRVGDSWNVRVDQPARGSVRASSNVVSTGGISGTCGYSQPVWPSVTRGGVAYLLFEGGCGGPPGDPAPIDGSALLTRALSAQAMRGPLIRPSAGSIPFTYAIDGSTTYWVRDPRVDVGHIADDCSGAASKCVLMRGGIRRG